MDGGLERRFTIGGLNVALFPAARAGSPLVLLNGEAGEAAAVCDAVRRHTGGDFSLAAVSGFDWNADLSPWPAPPVFAGGEAFGGGADAYLLTLTERVLPRVVDALGERPAWTGLAGYSLAGLFAVYSLYRTEAFSRVASASGSIWFPGFIDFARCSVMRRTPDGVYLSLGDGEARTRNPALRTVRDDTEALYRHYADMGIPATFELNPGNHFRDVTERTARGIAWMLSEAE